MYDVYESPWGIGGARHYPFGYEKGNTKESPKGIGDTANTPLCMIVKTRTEALGSIGGLANTLSGMRVKIRRTAPNVLAVSPIPTCIKDEIRKRSNT